jgi:hypothetical protein
VAVGADLFLIDPSAAKSEGKGVLYYHDDWSIGNTIYLRMSYNLNYIGGAAAPAPKKEAAPSPPRKL